MKPSPAELTAPAGIYFTDAEPYPDPGGSGKLYDRRMIATAVGIPYERTEYDVRIDRERLPGIWVMRHLYTLCPEWIYATRVPVDVTMAVVDHGPVSELP